MTWEEYLQQNYGQGPMGAMSTSDYANARTTWGAQEGWKNLIRGTGYKWSEELINSLESRAPGHDWTPAVQAALDSHVAQYGTPWTDQSPGPAVADDIIAVANAQGFDTTRVDPAEREASAIRSKKHGLGALLDKAVDPFDLADNLGIKKLAGTKLGSVLSGRAILQGGAKEQDMSDAYTFDLMGSPATAETKYQGAARLAALLYGGYAAAGALGTGAGAGEGAGVYGGLDSGAIAGAEYGTAEGAGLAGAYGGMDAGAIAGADYGAGAAAGGSAGGAAGGAAAGTALSRILSGAGTAADYLSLAGSIAPAVLGAYASNRQSQKLEDLANRYMEFGAPSRARFEGSFAPGFTMASEPGYKDALDQATKSFLHKASIAGNPADSPNAWKQTLTDVNAKFAYPALQDYRKLNANTGGLSRFAEAAPGVDMAAITAGRGVYDAIGAGAADVFNPRRSLEDILRSYRYA